MTPDPGLTIPWSGILVLAIAVGTFLASLFGNWLGTWLGMRKFTRLLTEASEQKVPQANGAVPPGFPRPLPPGFFDAGPMSQDDDEFSENLAQLKSRVK